MHFQAEEIQANAAEALVNATRNHGDEVTVRIHSLGISPLVLMCGSHNLQVRGRWLSATDLSCRHGARNFVQSLEPESVTLLCWKSLVVLSQNRMFIRVRGDTMDEYLVGSWGRTPSTEWEVRNVDRVDRVRCQHTSLRGFAYSSHARLILFAQSEIWTEQSCGPILGCRFKSVRDSEQHACVARLLFSYPFCFLGLPALDLVDQKRCNDMLPWSSGTCVRQTFTVQQRARRVR